VVHNRNNRNIIPFPNISSSRVSYRFAPFSDMFHPTIRAYTKICRFEPASAPDFCDHHRGDRYLESYLQDSIQLLHLIVPANPSQSWLNANLYKNCQRLGLSPHMVSPSMRTARLPTLKISVFTVEPHIAFKAVKLCFILEVESSMQAVIACESRHQLWYYRVISGSSSQQCCYLGFRLSR
jgi:hypothetical protein